MKKDNLPFISLIMIIPGIILILALNTCSKKTEGPNIILISVDTLRADHLHCYGYERETSPNIDKIAQDAIVFENAISQSAWTLPAHASMMTGLFPYEHGLIYYDNKGLEHKEECGTLDRKLMTLAKILRRYNYKTISFNGGAWVDPAFGLGAGFHLYTWGGRYFKDNVEKSIKWIDKNKKKKFFLFLHAYDVHPPFNASGEFNIFYEYKGPLEKDKIEFNMIENVESPEYEYILSQYDAGIRRADYYLGQLFEYLKQIHIFDNTILIITSDHGEMLKKRHGKWGHIYPLYEELIKVPLIIKVPGYKGKVIKNQVPASVSILPTITDMLGIRVENVRKVFSLVPQFSENGLDFKHILSETGRIEAKRICQAVRTDKWKLAYYTHENHTPKFELFDLKNDYEEQKNVADQNLAVSNDLFTRLKNMIRATPHETIKKRIDKKALEQLRSLGYIK